MCRDHDSSKKSSSTAKTALGLAIGGLSLAAVNGGALGGGDSCGCNGGGGLLSGLFGGGSNGACKAYQQQKMDRGAEAVTEVNMLDKYIMPMMGQICEVKAELAVNNERDQKNQIINSLLFKMADQHSENLFERAQCCCEKNQITMANMYDRLASADTCLYDRLDSKIDCVSDKATMRTDATFALRKAQVDAQLAEAMCGVIKGKPYLSPMQLADPYQAGSNVLISRHIQPQCASSFSPCGCGDNGWAW